MKGEVVLSTVLLKEAALTVLILLLPVDYL